MPTRAPRLLAATLLATSLSVLAPATTPAVGAAGLAHAASAGSAGSAGTTGTTARRVRVSDGCLRSRPEPGTSARTDICYTVFRPARATRQRPVPMIMHSHGWGGSRTTGAAAFRSFTAAGYGVISFDQRGWGESGGLARVEAPAFEGVDVRRLVRLVSRMRWVQQDRPGDPRLGAIGGSYGGGYQFVGAFEALRLEGRPLFDALAPEITWNDVSDSLAPEGVVRTEWASVLAAAALPSAALPPSVYQAFVAGLATGSYPDGSVPGAGDLVSYFEKNGPRWHVENGRRLPIPVLFGQGTTDSLFPLQQGLANWRTAITRRARQQSIFVGYNGGHVLPAVLPQGVSVTSDPCSRKLAGGDFEQLSVRFFDEQLKGVDRGLRGYGRLHLATPASRCTSVDSVRATRKVRLGTITSPTVLGVPVAHEVAAGPLRLAGTPYLTGAVSALGLDNRVFYGLAVGRTPLDARLVQNNVLPLSEPRPVDGVRRRVALPSVAVDVPRGQHLYLLASPISDTFAAMGSRVPGVVTIDDTVAHLPVVRR